MKSGFLRLALGCFIFLMGLTTQIRIAQAQQGFESIIVNNFSGLNYGNIYKLQNGQIWEQTEAWVWVWVWAGPRVIIYNDGGWRMKVENIDHPVAVQRIK